jgi:hypothetical protein
LIESARHAGRATDEQWRQYARQAAAARFEAKVRRRIRRGDRLTVWLSGRPPRMGRASGLHYEILYDGILVDGRTVRTDALEGVGYLLISDGRHGTFGNGVLTSGRTADPYLAGLPYGPHSARASFELKIYDGDSVPGGLAGARRPEPLAVERLSAETSFTLVPASEQAVRLNSDATLEPAVRKSLGARCWVAGGRKLYVFLSADRPPTALACRVFVRAKVGRAAPGANADGGDAGGDVGGGWREWPVDDPSNSDVFVVPAGQSILPSYAKPLSALPGFGGADQPGRRVDVVDVVLRPDPSLPAEAGFRAVDVEEIWGREVVIRDVPVKWD